MPRISWGSFVGVVLLHAGALAWLAHLQPSAAVLPAAPALMVEMIASMPEAHQPKPLPSKVSPPAVRPVQPAPPVPAAAPVLASKGESVSTVAETPKPTPAAPAMPTTPVAPAAPVVLTPSVPRFDADYLNNPSPAYPPLSRRLREEGKVMLRVFVEASGAAGTVEIRTSSGFERLDKSAVTAVSRWKFVPAKQGTEAVGAWVVVPIIFSLKD